MTARIGLFGGCFNPVHNGHVAVARAARAQLELDQVLFIPSGQPPLKGKVSLIEGVERLAMLNLALANEPNMQACNIEIVRAGPSYTADTVNALDKHLGSNTEMIFIIGSDCLDRLPLWKGIDDLHARLRFAVVQRPGAERTLQDRRLLKLNCVPSSVSSTEVRQRLAAGRSVADLVHPAVANYLLERGYYASSRKNGQ